MKDIPSDGDCLYHAVAHQLSKFEINENAQSLRVKCANHIRSHPDDFCAFLETDLDTYCNKVIFKTSNLKTEIVNSIIINIFDCILLEHEPYLLIKSCKFVLIQLGN